MILEYGKDNQFALSTVKIILSLIVAIILSIIVLPDWLVNYRPNLVVLVLIYWCLMRPEWVGLLAAFLVGLLMDAIQFNLLGHHVVSSLVVIYFVQRYRFGILSLPVLTQSLVVLLLLLVDLAVFTMVNLIWHDYPGQVTVWFSPLVGALLWFSWMGIAMRPRG